MRVAGCGLDFKDAVADIENRDVKSSTTEIEDQDRFVLLFVEAVGQRGGCGLIDDSQHIKPGNLSRILCGLPLRIIEVGGNGNDRIRHLFSQILGRVVRKFPKHLCRDFLRRVQLAHNLEANGIVLSRNNLEWDVLYFCLHFRIPAPNESLC